MVICTLGWFGGMLIDTVVKLSLLDEAIFLYGFSRINSTWFEAQKLVFTGSYGEIQHTGLDTSHEHFSGINSCYSIFASTVTLVHTSCKLTSRRVRDLNLTCSCSRLNYGSSGSFFFSDFQGLGAMPAHREVLGYTTSIPSYLSSMRRLVRGGVDF